MVARRGEPLRWIAGPSSSLVCREHSAADGRADPVGWRAQPEAGSACGSSSLAALSHAYSDHHTATVWLPTLGQRVRSRHSGHREVTGFGFFNT